MEKSRLVVLSECGPQGSTWNRTQDHYEAFTSKSRLQIWDFKRGYCSIHIQHLCSEPENTCTVEQHMWIVIYSIDINT